jgi:hypothetical protein
MTQFEYVSVAVALTYTFAVARVIGALPSLLAPGRRDWIPAMWGILVLLVAITHWWTFWSFREVEWTQFRFAWALVAPGLIHVRMNVLLSSNPAGVANWTEQFERARIPFFAVGVLIILNLAILPQIMGTDPWAEVRGRDFMLAALLIVYAIALASGSRRVQAGVVLINFAIVAVGFLPAGL